MLTAENDIDCCLNSPAQTEEHSDSSNVCVCVLLSDRFVVVIILPSFPLSCKLSLVTTRNISSSQHHLLQGQLNLSFLITITDSTKFITIV